MRYIKNKCLLLLKSLGIHCLHYALCLFLLETNSKIKQVPNYSHTYKTEDKNKLKKYNITQLCRVAGIQSLQSNIRGTAKIRFSLQKMSYFPATGLLVIKLVGSYVNIAEVVDIICCGWSVTRFTMVFGKFFAFSALKNKNYCIYKCLKW